MGRKNLKIKKLMLLLFTVVIICIIPTTMTKADTASAISFGNIDYENLTLQVFNNNNSVVYYTTDKSEDNSWVELEAAYDSSSSSYSMDISWVSDSKDVTIYFKGNTVEKIKSITIPAQNSSFSVIYDKADGSFDFEDTDNAYTFQWRKSSDYYWHTVDLDDNSGSYASFLNTMDDLRCKGAKIIFRIDQVQGTGADDTGARPSEEQMISITTRGAAPTVKVNSIKLTVNTTTAMEYYNDTESEWEECNTNMALQDIAPKALYENGGKTVKLKIRKAATDSTPYSETTVLTISGQTAAPAMGDNSSAVTHYIMNSSLVLIFNKASAADVYQYCIVDSGDDFNTATAGWRTVTSAAPITLTSNSAQNGDMIYIRKRGTDATAKDDVVLSSAVNSFMVSY